MSAPGRLVQKHPITKIVVLAGVRYELHEGL